MNLDSYYIIVNGTPITTATSRLPSPFQTIHREIRMHLNPNSFRLTNHLDINKFLYQRSITSRVSSKNNKRNTTPSHYKYCCLEYYKILRSRNNNFDKLKDHCVRKRYYPIIKVSKKRLKHERLCP